MPTAEEFATKKHKAVASATCQLENTSPEKERTSLSRGRSQHGSSSRSKLSSPFPEGKEITSNSSYAGTQHIFTRTSS